jgi:hypothetical protein
MPTSPYTKPVIIKIAPATPIAGVIVGVIGSATLLLGATVALELAVCVDIPTTVLEDIIALLVEAAALEVILELSLLVFAAALDEAEAAESLEVEATVVDSAVDWSLACRGRTC